MKKGFRGIVSDLKKISTITHIRDNFVDGEINGYLFQIQVFEKPSRYGIDNGRVSRLNLLKRTSKRGFINVAQFDRGWIKKPKKSSPEGEIISEILLTIDYKRR